MDKSKGMLTLNNNSFLFLEFMISNGFKPENSDNILELVQSVPGSLSQYLKSYKQFLLSRAVKYSDLKTYGIKGAYGYVEESEGIVVPKTIIADEYFREKQGRLVGNRIKYNCPRIDDFDTVVAYEDWTGMQPMMKADVLLRDESIINLLNDENLNNFKQITATLDFEFKNRYFGFMVDKDYCYLSNQNRLLYILDGLNKASNKEYTLIHDTDSCKNKELYLIRNK